MAQNDIASGGNLEVVDKRRTGKAGATSSNIATPANYASVAAMRTRLTAINAAYYTAARLDQMSKNDMKSRMVLVTLLVQ